MGFSVDTVALAGLPRLLDRLSDDARASVGHLAKYSDLGAGEGLFNQVLGGHRTAVAQVNAFFSGLDRSAGSQSANVQTALNSYRHTDLAAAAALDATMPTVAGAPWSRPDPGGGGFADRAEPQDRLTAPKGYPAYSLEMTWHSYLSPTSYGRWVIWEATSLATRLGICDRPIDIFIEWLKPWLGDWEGLRVCADVYEDLALAATAMNSNVQSGAVDSQPVWTGNAADGCRRDLNDTHLALGVADERLRTLAAEYRKVADTVQKLAKSVSGLVVVAVDLAVMALLELQAAVATSATVIGALAFGAASVHTIWKVIETGMKIYDCLKLAEYATTAFFAAAEGWVIDPGRPLPAMTGSAPADTAGVTGSHNKPI